MAKAKSKPKEKSQKERFIEKARELEADETGEAFERAIKKVIPARPGTVAGRRHEKPENPENDERT